MRLQADTPLFAVPAGLVRILDRDLVMAGIAHRRDDGTIDKGDERGRTIDVHVLRTTFGTLLRKGGVAPRTAQAAMRHSKLELTMNTYTGPKLLDVSGAMDALPDLPLDRDPDAARAKATGTDDAAASPLAPKVSKSGARGATPVNRGRGDVADGKRPATDVSADSDRRNNPLSHRDNGRRALEPRGLEPLTSCMPCKRSPN